MNRMDDGGQFYAKMQSLLPAPFTENFYADVNNACKAQEFYEANIENTSPSPEARAEKKRLALHTVVMLAEHANGILNASPRQGATQAPPMAAIIKAGLAIVDDGRPPLSDDALRQKLLGQGNAACDLALTHYEKNGLDDYDMGAFVETIQLAALLRDNGHPEGGSMADRVENLGHANGMQRLVRNHMPTRGTGPANGGSAPQAPTAG